MIDHSKAARENAIAFETKKDSLRQRQDGTWFLGLVVAAIDMDNRITQAAMGTRFQCILVEISDDETPVDHKAQERDKWRDLGPTRQAGMRCKDPTFWAFLREEEASRLPVTDENGAAEAVRMLCGVASRSDLGKPAFHHARIAWHQIDLEYRAWKAVEHA